MTQVPPDLDGHIVLTGADGELRIPGGGDVTEMVTALTKSGKGVLHFHGGLVSEESGLAGAAELAPVYTDAGAYPIFFIWRSDVISVLRGNLVEIGKEEIFKRLLKKVLGFAAAKLEGDEGAKGFGLAPVAPRRVDQELERRERDEEPFPELAADADIPRPPADEPELTDEEQADFEDDVAQDDALLAHVEAAVSEADPDAEPVRARGIVVQVRASERSLMAPEAIAELQGQPGQPVARGLGFESVALVKKAVKVLVAVIRRHRSGRWHGLYATVVEEILREFYLANAGAVIWATMKRETLDTFQPGPKPRGGERFLAELGRRLPAQGGPQITLVGHSTGAVFINNLLGAVDRQRSAGALPESFRFRNVVFLAPACTFSDFAAVVARREHLWERFRMFTMTDVAERADRVFSFIYPHSLLYLVSGLLERDAEGRSEGGKPLVGLERWWLGDQSEPQELLDVRRLLRDDPESVVWSPTPDGADGPGSGAIRHGDFDNDPRVKESLKRLIAEG